MEANNSINDVRRLEVVNVFLVVITLLVLSAGLFYLVQQNATLSERITTLENDLTRVIEQDDNSVTSDIVEDDTSMLADGEEQTIDIDKDMEIIRQYYKGSYSFEIVDVEYMSSYGDYYAVLPVVSESDSASASLVTQALMMGEDDNGDRVVKEVIFDRNDMVTCPEIDNTGLNDVFTQCLEYENGEYGDVRETRP